MSDTTQKSIWEYIHGYAPRDNPTHITFYDTHDQTLYRDVSLQTIGQHGWELITVIVSPDGKRYEYFFKRDRAQGYPAGLSESDAN